MNPNMSASIMPSGTHCPACGLPYFASSVMTGGLPGETTCHCYAQPQTFKVQFPPASNSGAYVTYGDLHRIVAEEVERALREHGLIGDGK
jgi:hypothetical protein